MRNFRFSLDQVLQYRQQLEEQAMLALAQVQARLDARRRDAENCVNSILAQREKLSRAAELSPDDYWLTSGYITALTQDLEQARADIAHLEKEMDRCRTVLMQKAMDKKVLENLKKRREKQHIQVELHREQQSYDEIATLRFTASTL